MSRLSGASYPPAHAHYVHISDWKGLLSTMGVLQNKLTHLYLNNASPNNVTLLGPLL